jgi:hypothetical protein
MVIVAESPAEVRQLLISRLKVRFLPRSPFIIKQIQSVRSLDSKSERNPWHPSSVAGRNPSPGMMSVIEILRQ